MLGRAKGLPCEFCEFVYIGRHIGTRCNYVLDDYCMAFREWGSHTFVTFAYPRCPLINWWSNT